MNSQYLSHRSFFSLNTFTAQFRISCATSLITTAACFSSMSLLKELQLKSDQYPWNFFLELNFLSLTGSHGRMKFHSCNDSCMWQQHAKQRKFRSICCTRSTQASVLHPVVSNDISTTQLVNPYSLSSETTASTVGKFGYFEWLVHSISGDNDWETVNLSTSHQVWHQLSIKMDYKRHICREGLSELPRKNLHQYNWHCLLIENQLMLSYLASSRFLAKAETTTMALLSVSPVLSKAAATSNVMTFLFVLHVHFSELAPP